ncbi:Fur family transcriptional regulator [Arenibacter troitsensis]|uniref:Fur family transcriptional regulator, ferric uptake regulator n=1 Tax=Arenibacter troitsensis TaxID=188872 RepID=A0A1X7L4D9_9FLAO|nr:transcriptional repressor [Arenibacter troitsensis]SMG48082.1 Fur family transcriptional regulator, ferric uptake regulator [Arenibacter troitsensis]
MNRRNTPTKEAVLNLLMNSRNALSQDAIERQLDIEINRATIYRVLNRFCEDGIVHKIVAEDGKQYFAICKKCENPQEVIQPHFHFRCLSCDTIECLQVPVECSVPNGYEVQNANCVLTGTCNNCSLLST